MYQVIGEGTYAGLYSLNQQIDIRTTATDAQGDRSTAVVSVNAQSIPLFQFGVFYQGDLEIHNGPRMDFAGWVHTNSSLYLTSDNTYFQDNVTAADSVFWRRKPTSERLNGVYINNSAGDPIALTFDSRSDPGSSFVTKSNASFDGRLMNSSSGVTPLNLPLPAGLPAHRHGGSEGRRRRRRRQERQVRVEGRPAHRGRGGQADRTRASAIRHQPWSSTAVPGWCPRLPSAQLIFRASRTLSTTAGKTSASTCSTSTSVGSRPGSRPTRPAKPIDIIYVTFIHATVTPGAPYTLAKFARGLSRPCVSRTRCSCATRSPSPRTARCMCWGDYNDVGWQPASILGDAITFLSPNWTDAAHVWNAVDRNPARRLTPFARQRMPRPMNVYAAIAAGSLLDARAT